MRKPAAVAPARNKTKGKRRKRFMACDCKPVQGAPDVCLVDQSANKEAIGRVELACVHHDFGKSTVVFMLLIGVISRP
jgi:hypothetical protein